MIWVGIAEFKEDRLVSRSFRETPYIHDYIMELEAWLFNVTAILYLIA